MEKGSHTGFSVFFTTSVLWQIVNLEMQLKQTSLKYKQTLKKISDKIFSHLKQKTALPWNHVCMNSSVCSWVQGVSILFLIFSTLLPFLLELRALQPGFDMPKQKTYRDANAKDKLTCHPHYFCRRPWRGLTFQRSPFYPVCWHKIAWWRNPTDKGGRQSEKWNDGKVQDTLNPCYWLCLPPDVCVHMLCAKI